MDRNANSIKNEFERSAASYDLRWAHYNLGSHLATIQHLVLAGHEKLLDLGCGTGELERHILCRWPGVLVVGIDLCTNMIGHARSKFSPRLPVRFICGNGQALPVRSESFDAAVSCSAYHFIPDRKEALRELVRVLKPGGRLVLTDWCADFMMCRLVDAWLVATGRAAHAGSLGSSECRSVAQECGLVEMELTLHRVGWIWGLMTLVARKP